VALLIAGCSDDDGSGVGTTSTVGPTLSTLVTSTSAGAPTTGAMTTDVTTAGATTTPTTTPTTTMTLPPTTTTSTTSTTTTTSTTLPPTTTTIVTQGAVVRVANATDINGAAGNLSQQLRDRTFTVGDPVNAAGPEEKLDVSKVYFKPEAEAVARSVAMLMGDVVVLPLPSPAPIVGANVGLGDAGVLVMLGRDLAGKVELR